MNAHRAGVLTLCWLSLVVLLAGPSARPANAEIVPWETASYVGPSEVVFTVDLICTSGGLVCDVLDDYEDQQVAELVGSGMVDLDLGAGTIQFLPDGIVDLFDGMGPRSTYARGVASDMTFAPIPFIGAPQTEVGAVFALTNPVLSAGGPLVPGSYPISAVVSYSAIADIVGPVDAYLPLLLLAPADVTLSGTLQILTVAQEGIFYQLRDMTASTSVANPTTLLGESVTVSVTADMTLNIAGFQEGASALPSTVPGLGGFGVGALSLALCLAGARASRTRSRSGAQERRAS